LSPFSQRPFVKRKRERNSAKRRKKNMYLIKQCHVWTKPLCFVYNVNPFHKYFLTCSGSDIRILCKLLRKAQLNILPYTNEEPGELSRYSDWLRAGRPKGRSSSPGRSKNFLLSTWSRPTLGPIQPLIQWVQRSFPRG
jgi:hypothetical protein